MQPLLEMLKQCVENHTFDSGDPDNPAVLDQLFCAYQDSHETDPPEIKDGFKELGTYLRQLSLVDKMRYGICAAGSARPMNTKPSSTDSDMVYS